MFRFLRQLAFLLTLVALAGAVRPAHAAERVANLYSANMEFRKGHYDRAVVFYRRHLRQYPRDFNTWNQLAAAYYHTGLPDTALLILKRVQNVTTQRSYNFYYQGLCYDGLEIPLYAKAYYQYASRYNDEYASRALFELAVIANNEKDAAAAAYWLDQYTRRFPQGVFIAQAKAMQAKLKTGEFTPDAKGNERPDIEAARYKYNKWSLMNRPHFWFFQTGYLFEQGTQKNPKSANDPQLVTEPYSTQDLKMNVGIGLGPFKQNNAEAYFGYTYFQSWGTDMDRINTYFDDPGDLNYLPFRADLLERKHTLMGVYNKYFPNGLILGIKGSYQVARVGSSFFPSPDNQELQKVLRVGSTTLLIPSIGLKYYKDFETSLYLYLRKEINEEISDASNKTYSFFDNNNDQTYSFGISHYMPIPQWNAKVTAEIFSYDFIYNDYFLDYTRTGFLLAGQSNFMRFFSADVVLGMYNDRYQLDRIKRGGCSAPSADGSDDSLASSYTCARTDQGMIYQLTGSWNISPFQRLSGYINYVENKNKTLPIYDKTTMRIGFMFTMAFPSISRVSPFFERFGDYALTKEAE